jgi:uncharacterized protein
MTIERMRSVKGAWIVGSAALLFALVAVLYLRSPTNVAPPVPAPVEPTSKSTLLIATSGTGGAYYPLGRAFAEVLSKYLPVEAKTEVTGGSVDNLGRIGSGQSEIGFSIADAALEAFNGERRFAGGKIPLRTLLVLNPNRMQVVTIAGTGIEKMADLKGKRVSTGVPGSATEATALRLLEAIGLDKDKDIKRERMSPAEAAAAIKERKLDAFFWLGGVPTAAVGELAAMPGVKIKLVDHADLVTAINAKYGSLYSKGVIAAGSYPGQDRESRNADIWNILVADEKTADDFAYAVVKTIFDNKPELVALRRDAESLALAAQKRENSPIPFHPGAVRYFTERGLSF